MLDADADFFDGANKDEECLLFDYELYSSFKKGKVEERVVREVVNQVVSHLGNQVERVEGKEEI